MRHLSFFLCAVFLMGAFPSYAEEPVKDTAEKGISVYEYNAQGRRDPFAPLIAVTEKSKPRKGIVPLENYEASELKVIAILWGGKGAYAVVTLPDGKSYSIKKGIKVGSAGGKVYKITKDSVIIREEVKDYRGVRQERDLSLKLHKDAE
ncbi:MAG: pilus assembly protein PilP [Nitrospirales bacterium]|nr:pilus assembly protein PilP [Nitrospirales bacterium]